MQAKSPWRNAVHELEHQTVYLSEGRQKDTASSAKRRQRLIRIEPAEAPPRNGSGIRTDRAYR